MASTIFLVLFASLAFGQIIEQPLCGNGIVEGGEQCDGGSCCSHSCTFKPPIFLCRKAVSLCDIEDYCTGTSATCGDIVAPFLTVCRGAVDVCDITERCDGISPYCPQDLLQEPGFVCGRIPPGLPCMAPLVCNGYNKSCPGNAFLPSGTLCRPQNGTCDVPEYCNGLMGQCPENVFNKGLVCDVSKYGYNITCPGTRPDCPEDVKLAPTPVRPVSPCGDGYVDLWIGEECDDPTFSSPCCTTQCKFAANTTICRPKTGQCDVPEYCTGKADSPGRNTSTCPPDAVLPLNKVCRPAGRRHPCDAPEVCDGVHHQCPPDLVKTNTTICRAAFFNCDVPETCDGINKGCPLPDLFQPIGTPCRAANTVNWPCWNASSCTGTSPVCPPVQNYNC